jgi:hypothetical protein
VERLDGLSSRDRARSIGETGIKMKKRMKKGKNANTEGRKEGRNIQAKD